MPINHSFSVLMCNFKLVAKLSIFICIVMILCFAILAGVLGNIWDGFKDLVIEEFEISPEEVVEHPFKTIGEIMNFFSDFVKINSKFITMQMTYSVLIIALFRFFMVLSLTPTSRILYGKMTTGFDMGFINAFLETIWHNLLLALINAVVLTLIDGLIFLAVIYLAIWLTKLVGLIGLTVSLFILLSLITLRMVALCQWLPEYFGMEKKNILKAFVISIKPAFKNFVKNYLCMFVINVGFIAAFLATALPTLGLVPLLLVPTYMVVYAALSCTLNFSYQKHKYFIDNGVTVYDPSKLY